MRKQGILIIVLTVLFAVSLVLYFAVIKPMTVEEEVKEEAPDTEAGEILDLNNRFFLFGSIDRSEIANITVDNEYGGFTFVNDGTGDFYIEGYDTVNFNGELFSVLVNTSAYTLSKTKLGSSLSDEKLDEYGLLTPQASWTVTSLSGESYTVYVGDKLLTGGGYYCQLEGRRSAYVLDVSIESAVLVPVEAYVTPVLVAGISQDDYYLVEDFTVYKDSDMLFSLRLVEESEMINKEALAEVIMDYPTEYYPNSTKYYEIIYSYLSLVGDSCHKLGATAEDMEAVGLSSPAHVITFKYHGATFELKFSEKNEDGTYYAISNLYPNIIAVCSEEKFDYLEYDLIDWIDPYVFQQYVTNLKNIHIKTDTVEANYDLAHSFAEDGDAILYVNANGNNMGEADVANFRQYYKSFLAIAIQDYYANDEYCALTEAEMDELISDKANAYMTFSYTTLGGETTELSFYMYSTRHSVVTVNGVGEFYVLTDLVKKLENDTVRVLSGETVTAFDKN